MQRLCVCRQVIPAAQETVQLTGVILLDDNESLDPFKFLCQFVGLRWQQKSHGNQFEIFR